MGEGRVTGKDNYGAAAFCMIKWNDFPDMCGSLLCCLSE